MFDKLIESEPAGADFKNRRKYFMMSTLVVGVFFATAVVFSIYAAEVGLGNRDFELVEMLAPPDMVTKPEQIQRSQPRTQAATTTTNIPTRQSVVSRIDEPTIVPTGVSTNPSSQMSRPVGDYRLDKFDSDPVGGGPGREISDSRVAGPGGLTSGDKTEEKPADEGAPPQTKVNTESKKKPVTQTLGVVNGRASSLPKPNYPAPAKAIGAQGRVSIRVLIDEAGNVDSAKAVDGHPLLRGAAEDAARRARFTPTLLSGVPVKVTGVILYNFTK